MAYFKEERETVITMDDKEPDKMKICTYQRRMITKLAKIPGIIPTLQEFDERGRLIGVTYEISSKHLSIRKSIAKKGTGRSGGFRKIVRGDCFET